VIRRIFFTTDMTDFKEQRICIKFCFNLKKTAAETHRMLQEAFGNNAMSQSRTLWYKRFKDGWMSVDNDEHSGRPSISTALENIAEVREAILTDHRQTIHNVCEIVGLSYGTVQRILGKICTWDAFLRDLCQDCWVMTRRSFAFLSAGNSNNKPEMTPTSSPI